MKKMMVVAALVAAVGFGCKKKKPEEGTGGPTTGSDTGSAVARPGSAAGSGSAGAMAGSGSAAAPKPMTPDEIAKRFDQCWGYFNDGKFDDFKGCYAADATAEAPGSGMPPESGADAVVAGTKVFKDAFPDLKGEAVLEMVSGHTVVAVSFLSGTNTGVFKTPMGETPATKAKIGLMISQVIELGDDGKVKKMSEYYDMATMMGQMKPDPKHPVRPVMDKAPMAKEVVISKDDANEKANIETAKKVAESFSKHDAKAFGDVLADDVKWSEQAQPKDSDKKDAVAHAQAFWKAFSDVKITPGTVWAAGDYVAATGQIDGTNDGDLPMMGLKKTGKKVSVQHLIVFKIQGGKVKNAWLFDQSMGMAMQLGLMPPPGAAPGPGAGSGAGSGMKKDDKKPDDKKTDKKAEPKKG
jgi:predicted ester cyclase